VEISTLVNVLSEPFLDRIDLSVQMQAISPEDKSSLSSIQIHQLGMNALKMRHNRSQNKPNGKLNDQEISMYCSLDPSLDTLLHQAAQNFALSLRAVNKVHRVARTIADIEGSQHIQKQHLMEALSYRKR
jgi:magnesium chelatase family protein